MQDRLNRRTALGAGGKILVSWQEVRLPAPLIFRHIKLRTHGVVQGVPVSAGVPLSPACAGGRRPAPAQLIGRLVRRGAAAMIKLLKDHGAKK